MKIVAVDDKGTQFALPSEEEIPKWISESRDRLGLSLQNIADDVGVSRQAVWSWEIGKSSPLIGHMTKLISCLGIQGKGGRKRKAQPVDGEDAAVLSDVENILGA